MKKIILFLFFLFSLSACLPTEEPQADSQNSFRFENASSYTVTIAPSSSTADWSGFSLASGENKTITTSNIMISYSYSPATTVTYVNITGGKRFVNR